ncbi:hypothetical protein ACM615_24110, partial [Rahnella sp. PAMC25617]|uniref:hypothetical protein n=1 Tax=Rahnella sp. PAMC25617 TaxID=3399684 RepID=UPI003D35F8F4
LVPLIPNLSVCVCFKAAVLPEQIIYNLCAVYCCFIETAMVQKLTLKETKPSVTPSQTLMLLLVFLDGGEQLKNVVWFILI